MCVLHWLLGRKSRLSLENKILVHETIIRPICTYSIEICACKSNIVIIQTNIHSSRFISETIQEEAIASKLNLRANLLVRPLLKEQDSTRLRRQWPQMGY